MTYIRLSAAFLFALAASAQTPTVSYLEGTVYLADKPVQRTAALPAGSILRTAETGRAEIRLRGATLYVAASSSVRILDNQPFNIDRFEILAGSAVLATQHEGGAVAQCENTVTLSDSGVFRFDFEPIPQSRYGENFCHFRVYDGAASVQMPSYAAVLRQGNLMHLNHRAGDMVPRMEFATADIDDFYRWARQRTIARIP